MKAELIQKISNWSLKQVADKKLNQKLRSAEPDLSQQYSYNHQYNGYWELKRRTLHAFQYSLMLKAMENLPKEITIVDIGDSAGTHLNYLKELTDRIVHPISINLEPIAVQKIKSRGIQAFKCRAEELDIDEPDLFVSFQMLEHLHNPAIFLYRLSQKYSCPLLVTVPYRRRSQIGLHHLRLRHTNKLHAEDEHIFELSPEDWKLLMLHSGWRVVYEEIYYQYPKWVPFLGWLWQRIDFEGFWGAILIKNTAFSKCYQDWETASTT